MIPDRPDLETVLDMSWLPQGACSGVPKLEANWFPAQHQANASTTRRALEICQTCPVRPECLLYALLTERKDVGGIFGGHTEKERRKMRARLFGSPRHGIPAGNLPVIRTCSNPACRRRFVAVSPHVRRDTACSKACRLARRRLVARTARLNRPVA